MEEPFNHRYHGMKRQWDGEYFITYYGDIYHGTIVEHHLHDDRFFILSLNEAKEFRELKPEERTPEKYAKLSWEIRDDNVIIQTLHDIHNLGANAANINKIETNRVGSQKWKKMFVFGAGASANCVFGDAAKEFCKYSFRPPIGPGIFDERYGATIEKYMGVKSSIPEFIAKSQDIEKCIEEEWNEIKYYYNPQVIRRHINIQFYLQDVFQQISDRTIKEFYRTNLYALLATKIQKYLARHNSERDKERIAFVSFNYDTILDYFLAQSCGLDFSQMKGYMDYNNQSALLFKPHGSCNWGWQFRKERLNGMNGSLPDYIYNQQFNLSIIYYNLLGDIEEMAGSWGIEKNVNEHRIGKNTINKNKIEVIPASGQSGYFPALLLPYRDKDEFVMHYDHFHAMQSFAGEMEELYIIGWKGNEAVFNRLLRDHAHQLKKIIIVDPNADMVQSNLSSYIDFSRIKVEAIKDFETFVLEHLDTYLSE